jgi:hypothetical protein
LRPAFLVRPCLTLPPRRRQRDLKAYVRTVLHGRIVPAGDEAAACAVLLAKAQGLLPVLYIVRALEAHSGAVVHPPGIRINLYECQWVLNVTSGLALMAQ